MVGRHHKRIEAARAAQGQPGTKALLRRRSKVERKIDHLQDLGSVKPATARGRRKTRLQALFAATVANFKRLAVPTCPKQLPLRRREPGSTTCS